MKRFVVALIATVLVACTSAAPTVIPTSTPTTRSPIFAPHATFDASKALETIKSIVAFGPRESTSETYRLAEKYVWTAFDALGYRSRVQDFHLRAGTNDGIAVRAGTSGNVIAEPPGFDPSKPFVVVGGHLDTVPDSPGANDNASGIAIMLELARMATIEPPPLPVVFVAFGGEERRRQSRSESQFAVGSATYARSLRSKPRAAVILDMVGAGRVVNLLGTSSLRSRAAVLAAKRDIPTRMITTTLYSDHISFINRGIPSLWLWAAEHASFHSPRDTTSVIERAELIRVARIAWAVLGSFRST